MVFFFAFCAARPPRCPPERERESVAHPSPKQTPPLFFFFFFFPSPLKHTHTHITHARHPNDSLLHEAGLHEFEAALVMNLAPETADEALALVPSLAQPPGRWDASGGQAAAVEKVLADVAAYRAFD